MTGKWEWEARVRRGVNRGYLSVFTAEGSKQDKSQPQAQACKMAG